MSRIRWLILLIGPLPIAGSSWAVSAWFRSPPFSVAHNTVAPAPLGESRYTTAFRPSPVLSDADVALEGDCAQAAARLERELHGECRVVVRAPFVLAGDLARDELEEWHDTTIAPAVRAMEGRYFKTRPTQPVTVLLFRNEQSYNHYCRRLFGDGDISIYGYYKPNLRTMVLNVGTGSGTLLHELTHALVDFDFPQAPDWLNEGLASMHEQCRFRDGADGPWIEGLVNWRLAGLQEVVRQGQLRSLEALVEDRDFRGPLVGTNYAQARYFCLYMQQCGVLEKYFCAFRDSHRHDPRGAKAIADVFGPMTWAELDRDFQRWVLQLAE